MLTRDAILQADDLPSERMDMPEWGGPVWIRTLTGTERDAFEQAMISMRGKLREVNLRNARAKMAVMVLCDEQGQRLFRDEDADALGKKSSKALDRIFDAAQRLNGMRKQDVEELTENFPDGPSASSTSCSPSPSA